MSNDADDAHWLPILVRGDVTEWERKFCASLIAQTRRGRRLTDRQANTLGRIKQRFCAEYMREDAPLTEDAGQ